jgi:hypothetical protein
MGILGRKPIILVESSAVMSLRKVTDVLVPKITVADVPLCISHREVVDNQQGIIELLQLVAKFVAECISIITFTAGFEEDLQHVQHQGVLILIGGDELFRIRAEVASAP